MFTVKETESKVTPRKKTITLKNIAVSELKLIDVDTGEDITDDVLAEVPDGVQSVDFKMVFELDE